MWCVRDGRVISREPMKLSVTARPSTPSARLTAVVPVVVIAGAFLRTWLIAVHSSFSQQQPRFTTPCQNDQAQNQGDDDAGESNTSCWFFLSTRKVDR